jgi:hypothetical protein
MAGFIQIIEYTTSKADEIRAMGEQWRDERSGDAQGPVRLVALADRDHPGRYLTIAEFTSYDEAMANSQRDDTSQFAQRMAELCDGPPTFTNLDVVDQWEPGAR